MPFTTKLKALQTEIEAKQAKIEAVKAETEAVKAETEANQAKIEANQVEIEAVKAEIEVVLAKLKTQQVQLAELDTYQAKLDTYQAKLDTGKALLIEDLGKVKAQHDIVMQNAEYLKQVSPQEFMQTLHAMQARIQAPTPAEQEAMLATLQPKLDAAIKSSLANDEIFGQLNELSYSSDKMIAEIHAKLVKIILNEAECNVYLTEIVETQAATQTEIEKQAKLKVKKYKLQAELDTDQSSPQSVLLAQHATQAGIDSIPQTIRDSEKPELEATQAEFQIEKDELQDELDTDQPSPQSTLLDQHAMQAHIDSLAQSRRTSERLGLSVKLGLEVEQLGNQTLKNLMRARQEALEAQLQAEVNAQDTMLGDPIKTFSRSTSILFLTVAVLSLFLTTSMPLFIGSVSLAIGFALIPFAYQAIRESSWLNEKRKNSNEGTSEKRETVANVSSALTTLHTPTVTEEVSSLEPVGSYSKIFATRLSQLESITQLTPRP